MKSRAISAMANRLIKSHGPDAVQLAKTTSEQHRLSRDEYGALKWAEIAKAIERAISDAARREGKVRA